MIIIFTENLLQDDDNLCRHWEAMNVLVHDWYWIRIPNLYIVLFDYSVNACLKPSTHIWIILSSSKYASMYKYSGYINPYPYKYTLDTSVHVWYLNINWYWIHLMKLIVNTDTLEKTINIWYWIHKYIKLWNTNILLKHTYKEEERRGRKSNREKKDMSERGG